MRRRRQEFGDRRENQGGGTTILNVAEKPSVAKEVARYLASNGFRQERSHSRFNPVMKLEQMFRGSFSTLYVTSVTGHVMDLVFPTELKSWHSVDPGVLFTAPVTKQVKGNCSDIVKNLKEYAKKCTDLVLWLDCDREGENIAFEVIGICLSSNPRLSLHRAIFSALTAVDISRAWDNLREPDSYLSDAVDCRQELDLRMGAVMTRYLTLRFKQRFDLSAPFLRYLRHSGFTAEDFWSLKLLLSLPSNLVEFSWERGHLFDKHVVETYASICRECGSTPILLSVDGKPVTKKRPLPLTTTALTVLASRRLKLTSKRAMSVAESLYQKGFLSYPRTETNAFPETIDVLSLVQMQTEHPSWGNYAADLVHGGKFRSPSKGKADDKAHPPIHPVKAVDRQSLSEEEWKLYDLVTRHFLACCSDDAKGERTTVCIELNGERFHASGLVVHEKNYLTIYPFDYWGGKELPQITADIVSGAGPPEVKVVAGCTTPPPLLKEGDLIKLMEKHGIGTDATMHEHIQTIKDRQYVEIRSDGAFVPTKLGTALIKGFRRYRREWIDLGKPYLRAAMESDMSAIAEGQKPKAVVLAQSIMQLKRVFETITRGPHMLDDEMESAFGRNSARIAAI